LPGPDINIPGPDIPGPDLPGPDLPIPGPDINIPRPGGGITDVPGPNDPPFPQPRPGGGIMDTSATSGGGGASGGRFVVSADELARVAGEACDVIPPVDRAMGRVGTLVAGLDRRGWNAGAVDGDWSAAKRSWADVERSLRDTQRDLLGRSLLARVLNIFGLGGLLPWTWRGTSPNPRDPAPESYTPTKPGPNIVFDKPEGEGGGEGEGQGQGQGQGEEQGQGEGQGQGQGEEQVQPQQPGTIDETERQFTPEEREIAELLKDEGKDVKALPEKEGQRNPDAEVDGKPTEFKSPEPGADSATIRNEVNESIKGGGQARDIVIDARGTGMTEGEAERGLARVSGIARGRLDTVRIIGDGFDVVGHYE
jgi:hypothetical protein